MSFSPDRAEYRGTPSRLDAVPYIKEAPLGSPNSFVRFIDERKDALGTYAATTYELRDEEEGWKNSSTPEALFDKQYNMLIGAFAEVGLYSSKNPRAIKKSRDESLATLRRFIYREKDESDSDIENQ